jgi:hypothetical protein
VNDNAKLNLLAFKPAAFSIALRQSSLFSRRLEIMQKEYSATSLNSLPMRSRRTSRVLIVAFLLLTVSSVALWFARARTNVAIEMQHLVSEMHDENAQQKLIALGPKAYGELRRTLLYSDTPSPQGASRCRAETLAAS